MTRANAHYIAPLAALLLVGGWFALREAPPTLPVQGQVDINGDKPVIIVLTGTNCDTCSGIVEKVARVAAKYPDAYIVQNTADNVGLPNESAPAIMVDVPGVHAVYVKEHVTLPDDVDAYLAKHLAFAKREKIAVQEVADARSRYVQALVPFNKEVFDTNAERDDATRPIRDRARAAVKPISDQAPGLMERLLQAVGTLPQQVQSATDPATKRTLKAELDEKAKPFLDEAEALQAKKDAILAPFNAEIAAVSKPFEDRVEAIFVRRNQATESHRLALEKAESAMLALIAEHEAAL